MVCMPGGDDDARDFSHLDAPARYAVFDPRSPHALLFLRRVAERGPVRVAFHRKPLFVDLESTGIMLAQGLDTSAYHAEVWFGADRRAEAVIFGLANNGLSLYLSAREFKEGTWEVVADLPFRSAGDAMAIAVDCARAETPYHYSAGRVLMMRWPHPKKDLDPERPGTWTPGVHCSQAVLLFLKRCVLHGVLRLRAPDALMAACSHACLPSHLRALLVQCGGHAEELGKP